MGFRMFAVAFVLYLLPTSSAFSQRQATVDVHEALADYVKQPDASYQWTERRSGKLGTAEYVELSLTSQTWKDIPWRHQLFLIKPVSFKKQNSQALLLISGGRWKEEYANPPTDEKLPGEAQLLATVAEAMGTPIAIVSQVPFQPIFDGKVEDEIISYTFEQFMKTGDSEWPLLLPMVKSASKAMDAVQEYSRKEWSHEIKGFTVTGASKRGWTTWLTGATDERATAIAPMVIDMLNMQKHLENQITAWGKYSEQIEDYTERGLQDQMDSEAGEALRQIVDPYQYRDKLSQPKLLLIGTNDRYWPLDSLDLYWNDLSGDKYILYVPNKGHDLSDYQRVLGSLNALHQSQANNKPMPKLEWNFKRNGDSLDLTVVSDLQPSKVQAWIATSPTRDFREVQWTSERAKKNGAGDTYHYSLPIPAAGYAAVFGEAVYGEALLPFYLSTNVRIVSLDDVGGN